jgi:16S rRNA (cytosine1407-C5)-methyltransferase
MKPKNRPINDLIGRYRDLLSTSEASALETTIQNPPPTAVRFNALKTDPQRIASEFELERNWKLRPIPFCRDGFTVLASPHPPGRTLEVRLGYFYIQDAASMLPVELLEKTENPRPLLLDMTASPGGKSTHLAARYLDQGLLVANDGTASRIPALSSTLKTWGAVNSLVTNFPGERFGQWFPDTFDIVLLDAPCSMENLHPGDKNKREIKPAERGRLAHRQEQLLLSALQACKPGGQVIYSTCTLAPEEDEAVLDSVLQHTGKSMVLTDAGVRLGIDTPGLTSAFGQIYTADTRKALRLWPQSLGTSGFFCAHLVKESPLPGPRYETSSRPFGKSNLKAFSRKDQDVLCSFLAAGYGLDLPGLLEEQYLMLAIFKQSVYAIPRQLASEFNGLPVCSCGLRLGDASDYGFELSLEWATRFADRITQGRHTLSADMAVRWARGEDIPMETDLTEDKGTILVITDPHNRVLGTGRVSSRGIKNLLPRHLALKS